MKQTKIDELEKKSQFVIAKNQELKQKVCEIFAYMYVCMCTYIARIIKYNVKSHFLMYVYVCT